MELEFNYIFFLSFSLSESEVKNKETGMKMRSLENSKIFKHVDLDSSHKAV